MPSVEVDVLPAQRVSVGASDSLGSDRPGNANVDVCPVGGEGADARARGACAPPVSRRTRELTASSWARSRSNDSTSSPRPRANVTTKRTWPPSIADPLWTRPPSRDANRRDAVGCALMRASARTPLILPAWTRSTHLGGSLAWARLGTLTPSAPTLRMPSCPSVTSPARGSLEWTRRSGSRGAANAVSV